MSSRTETQNWLKGSILFIQSIAVDEMRFWYGCDFTVGQIYLFSNIQENDN